MERGEKISCESLGLEGIVSAFGESVALQVSTLEEGLILPLTRRSRDGEGKVMSAMLRQLTCIHFSIAAAPHRGTHASAMRQDRRFLGAGTVLRTTHEINS
jgi:hypothetical protein